MSQHSAHDNEVKLVMIAAWQWAKISDFQQCFMHQAFNTVPSCFPGYQTFINKRQSQVEFSYLGELSSCTLLIPRPFNPFTSTPKKVIWHSPITCKNNNFSTSCRCSPLYHYEIMNQATKLFTNINKKLLLYWVYIEVILMNCLSRIKYFAIVHFLEVIFNFYEIPVYS